MPLPSGRALLGFLVGVGAFAGATGCGHPVQSKLEGRWVGDSVENFDDRHVAVATGWARGASLEFSASNLTVAVPAEDPRTGAYKVASVRENTVELAVTRKDGAKDKLRLKLDSEHSIRWMLSDERAIVLRRE
ncbi:MAG: hypothetical protein IT377_12465 [Polyangiaceae bacterium]|nr:hypothetical protein [Myxococcales bacterium]MCC6899784.1 hypothetical protein [Polyangiaceae bacterium]